MEPYAIEEVLRKQAAVCSKGGHLTAEGTMEGTETCSHSLAIKLHPARAKLGIMIDTHLEDYFSSFTICVPIYFILLADVRQLFSLIILLIT